MYQLEKLGWARLSNEQFDMSLIQRKGYFEIFINKSNRLELTLFEDGGLTICGGTWSNMSPEEVKAMNDDLLSIAALTYADKERLTKVIRDSNSAEDDMEELVGINEFGLNRYWRYTKFDFNVKGFGIIHVRSETAQVQIYVDDVNPVKQFKADILIITEHSQEHNTYSSNEEKIVLNSLSTQRTEPYVVAKDLLEACISKVRSV